MNGSAVAGDLLVEYPKNVRQIIFDKTDGIVALYGGEMKWHLWNVAWHKKRGEDRGTTIRYGKNLSDLAYEQDETFRYVACVPYWLKDSQIAMLTPQLLPLQDGMSTERAIALDLTSKFDTYPVLADLEDEARKYMWQLVKASSKKITVKFSQMENGPDVIQAMRYYRLGDTLNLVYTDYGINEAVRVTKTVYNPLLERYESIELGLDSDS